MCESNRICTNKDHELYGQIRDSRHVSATCGECERDAYGKAQDTKIAEQVKLLLGFYQFLKWDERRDNKKYRDMDL